MVWSNSIVWQNTALTDPELWNEDISFLQVLRLLNTTAIYNFKEQIDEQI